MSVESLVYTFNCAIDFNLIRIVRILGRDNDFGKPNNLSITVDIPDGESPLATMDFKGEWATALWEKIKGDKRFTLLGKESSLAVDASRLIEVRVDTVQKTAQMALEFRENKPFRIPMDFEIAVHFLRAITNNDALGNK